MFEAGAILFMLAGTPVHAGSGRELGGVDLPLQRERFTRYPIIQGSSLKGMLRSVARSRAGVQGLDPSVIEELFGPEKDRASEHAGAISVGDARVLLFPVRSLVGVYGWVTSPDVLARLRRDASVLGIDVPWQLPVTPDEGCALLSSDGLIASRDQVVLEEFAFAARVDEKLAEIADWLATTAIPDGEEMDYWRDALRRRLVLLTPDAFRDFTLFATEITTRIRLNPLSKTVEEGGLWTEENLPADTLLYAPLMASPSRRHGGQATGRELLQRIEALGLRHVQLGGHTTIGRGLVSVRLVLGGQ